MHQSNENSILCGIESIQLLYSEHSLKQKFVLTAKFVRTSIRSAKKSANRVFFH